VNPNHLQVLSRFFDGESVEPALLAESLAEPDAATYLAECAALRAWIRDDESRPSERFYDAMHRALSPANTRRALWRRLVRPALAASLLLVGAALGYEIRARIGPPSSMSGIGIGTGTTAMSPVARRPAEPQSTAMHTPPEAAPRQKAEAPPRPGSARESVPVPVAQLRFASWRETGRGGEEH
jgi:hypothetical protein